MKFYFVVVIIEFDNDFNIKNKFEKNYENSYGHLNNAILKVLKNGKILYMGSRSSYKKGEEELIGITKIYILNFNKLKNELYLETKINAFKTYFYCFYF